MADNTLELNIKDEHIELFKRCVRKLLNSTFIVGDKDDRLYSFISMESHRRAISEYLSFMGFDVFVDNNVKVAMLKLSSDDEDTVGLKRANLITFNTVQYHILLVLWSIYLENIGFYEQIAVSKGDFIDRLQTFGVNLGKNPKTSLSNALEIFKKYDLINYDPKDSSEDAMIIIYPSVQFGWDVSQFKVVAEEYINTKEDNDEDEREESLDDFAE